MDRQPPRTPNANDLTDDELGALLAQGWNAADDGTLTPPSGGDAPLPAPSLPDAGGFGAAPSGLPATAPPAGPPSPPLSPAGAAPDTLPKAGAPKLNARIEFDPDSNPMKDALPTPFDAPDVTPPLRSQDGPDLKSAASKRMGDTSGGGYQGKVGRRMQQRGSSPATSRRRR